MKFENLTRSQTTEFLSGDAPAANLVSVLDSPSIPQLQELIRLDHEVAFLKVNGMWFAFKGNEFGIPVFLVPHETSTFLHTHNINSEDPEDIPEEAVWLPSLRDFHNAKDGTSSFIAAPAGLVAYSPPVSSLQKREIERELKAFNPRFNHHSSVPDYLEFLDYVGLRYRFTKWSDLTEDEFQEQIS